MDPNKILINNLHTALAESQTLVNVTKDFRKTFGLLGCCPMQIAPLAAETIRFIREAQSIEEAEKNIRELFTTATCNDENVFELIRLGFIIRTDIIFDQVRPHVTGIKNAIDYGCGNGALAQMLQNRIGLKIEGVDVRDFGTNNLALPIYLFDGYSVPVPDKHYECAILTNVLHHETDNEKILQELDRIVSKRLVIIETVPEADSEEDAKKDWGRMLLNDTLWNRFFNHADIPVPGTYEIPSNWIKRFEKYGWQCTHSEDLGFDQPTIQDRHHLLVFER